MDSFVFGGPRLRANRQVLDGKPTSQAESQVCNEVIKRLKTLGRHGGLILAPAHFVQLDTPMENFRAMIDTITGTPYSSL